MIRIEFFMLKVCFLDIDVFALRNTTGKNILSHKKGGPKGTLQNQMISKTGVSDPPTPP